MSNQIALLHVSDLHARLKHEEDIEIRTKALFLDIEKQGVKVDAALITGDLAFSGKPEEYKLAERVLLTPLTRRLQIPKRNIYVVPGNHDVDRGLVDPIAEAGLVSTLASTNVAKAYVDSPEHGQHRLQAYHEFLRPYVKHGPQAPHCFRHTIRGIEIGFACFNSAWRCSGDQDKERLFLTETQVNRAIKQLEGCQLKLALVHHPFDWLHPSEANVVIPDLKRHFDIITSGHLHQPISEAEETTISECLMFTAPSIWEGTIAEGYNLYIIDFPNRKLTAKYRKFYRNRRAFDRDIEHAEDGEKDWSLRITDLVRYNHGLLCSRLDAVHNHLEAEVKKQLNQYQQLATPVYVTPRLKSVKWKDGRRRASPFQRDLVHVADGPALVYGPADAGKSILMQAVAAAINRQAAEAGSGRLAVYIDLKQTGTADLESLVQESIDQCLADDAESVKPKSITVFLDHVNDKTSDWTAKAREVFASRPEWTPVISQSNSILFDALLASNDYREWSFFEIGYWGPSTIREFARKFYEGGEVNVDAAVSVVASSLRDCDMPPTPMVIILYLTAFKQLGNSVSSLSFLQLVETIEEHWLDQKDTVPANSLYNKRRVLALLALECSKRDVLELPRGFVEHLIQSYFDASDLDVNIPNFLRRLHQSGIVTVTDEFVTFRYYFFYDYYLAKAFEGDLADVASATSDLFECIRSSYALAFYSGLIRNNPQVANRILALIQEAYGEDGDFDLAELDGLIAGPLLPHDASGTPDEQADASAKATPDYDRIDQEFDSARSEHDDRRKALSNLRSAGTEIQRIGVILGALKAFNAAFRNLENITVEEKQRMLEQALTLHVQVTRRLIRMFRSVIENPDAQTFCAYLSALMAQGLMATSMATQSLRRTIERQIESQTNEFKKLLLILLYADLRFQGYERLLEEFARSTTSIAGCELVYLKVHELLVLHEGNVQPVGLYAAFSAAFNKRLALHGDKPTSGALVAALEVIKRENLVRRRAQQLESGAA